VGMFAIVLHDDLEKKVYLIRDFFGIKPLFYVKIVYRKISSTIISAALPFP
jgi:asparagine synthetase B (glutamine-hydrolysing)